jgi:hypothetical protein
MRLNLSKRVYKRAGISTESAVKLLKSFEKDGLIKLNDKDIQVLNTPSLMEISKRG